MKNHLFTFIAIIFIFSSCHPKVAKKIEEPIMKKEVTEAKPSEEVKLPGDTSLPSTDAELSELIKKGDGNYKYSVEDFFRTPDKSRYQLSPDGTYFSYMGPYKRRQNIFIQKIGSDEAIRITSETERSISGYFWANNNRLIFIKDSGGDENFKLFAVDKDGANAKDLTPFEGVRIQIIDALKDLEDELIIGMNKNNKMLFEPYRINIETGEITQLAENTNPVEPIDSWQTDHEGKLRIASKLVNGTTTVLMYRKTETEPFTEVLRTNFKVSVSPLFFDFDNKDIVFVASNQGRDKTVITKLDMNTGKEVGTPLFSHPDVDVQRLIYSRKRKVLTAIAYTTDKPQYHFLDKSREALQLRLEKELPNYQVALTSVSKDESKYMVRTYSDKSLGAYYFYDKTTDKLEKIVEVSPWFDENDFASTQSISYKSRDGVTIHGYLTLPKGVDHKNLPIVVNPHGGPWARDNWGFNPEIQLLASRGYGVIQMNFRGSTGYGRDFWEKSFKQWGKTMQNDITDGVEMLIEKGIADPDKIAIYGASYGGYATLAGVTFTPDLYACAVDYVGVSNLFTFLNTIPPYWKPYLKMMYEMVGDPEVDQEILTSGSPALHVDKIKTPLFVVQGANDPRVNIDEADQIVRSLRERNVDVPYMVKYNEGHGFHNEENRYEFYKAFIGFLNTYMK